MNETEAVITSMNLYEYSQISNEEMGIVVCHNEDSDVYDTTFKEVKRIDRMSEDAETLTKTDTPRKFPIDGERPLYKMQRKNRTEPGKTVLRQAHEKLGTV